MTLELRHADMGTGLSRPEWESLSAHILASGVGGELIYNSAGQLKGLTTGTANQVLQSDGANPAWTSTITNISLASPTVTSGDLSIDAGV